MGRWQEAVPFTVEVHPDREAWLQARGIGSSDAATLLGHGRESRLELWGRLTGRIAAASNDNRYLRLGHALEPFIHRETEDELGTSLVNPGDFTIFRSKQRPWQTATPDRFITDPDRDLQPVLAKLGTGERAQQAGPAKALAYLIHRGVLLGPAEFKAVFHQTQEWDDEPPARTLIQVQHQLAVQHMEQAWVIALISGDELRVYRVQRHERLIARILEAEEEFWALVQSDTMPAIDGTEHSRAALGKLYPQDRGGQMVLGPEFVQVHRRLVAVKADIQKLTGERTALENVLKGQLGEVRRALIPGAQEDGRPAAYQWATVNKPAFSVKATQYRELREVKP